VKALVFRHNLAREAASAIGGHLDPRAFVSRFAAVRLEEVGGVVKHAIEHYFDFVSRGLDLTPVITHRFPLERWDKAVLAVKNSRRTGAVKVLLEPAR
jgi:threonine dehydrogenase-like Zn-dependent dehydrogenase